MLLCENQEGYRNLIKLVSTAYLDGFYYKPRIDTDLLARALQGADRHVGLPARPHSRDHPLRQVRRCAAHGAPVWRHLRRRRISSSKCRTITWSRTSASRPQLVRLSSETGFPLVATNDSHYLRKDDARAHEILMCIQTGKNFNDPNRMRWSTPDFYLKTRDEMMELFGELEDAVDRTWEIAQRCHVKLEKVVDPFPRFDIPTEHTTDTYFEYVARMGFEKRRPRLEAMRAKGALKHDLAEYAERLDREIKMIQNMKFSGYFLVVWDFIRYAKDMGIPVGPGRGSAAGSLVSYAMEITDIDPLQYGLLFERFLNPERVSFPDVDVDFCMNRRGEVIQYVTQKYGREQVAQIITFNTLGARAAIKDVGRVLEMPFADVERLTKMVPATLNISLQEAIRPGARLRRGGEERPAHRRRAEGGAAPGRPGAQLLGARRRRGDLAAAAERPGAAVQDEPRRNCDAVRHERPGQAPAAQDGLPGADHAHPDPGRAAPDPEAPRRRRSFRKTCRWTTRAPTKSSARASPAASSSSNRAACATSCAATSRAAWKTSPRSTRSIVPARFRAAWWTTSSSASGAAAGGQYDLPELKELLEETYGVIVYQEQVMQISNRIAGYSLGDADLLRRAMGKKKLEEMAKQRERFIKGALERGFPQKKVEKIFDLMEQFAGYGFNKSHSAAYAYLAFVTAYLKAHYPIDFMAALLTSETGNTAKVVKYINECREMGITILPPDVNHSEWSFTPDGEAIRFGLGAVKNLGQSAVEAIGKAREEEGRFTSLHEFCEKVDLGASTGA